MSENQRQQYRVPDNRKALLQLSQFSQEVVQLKDVSGSGFAIHSQKRLSIKPNTAYALRTSAGWSQVCLIYQKQTDDGFVYGLLRIADQRDARAEKRLISPNPGHSLKHTPPRERLASFWAFILIGFGLFVFLGYAYTHQMPWDVLVQLWSPR